MDDDFDNNDSALHRLRSLYKEVDETLRAEYSRSLSFVDGAFDRWERAKRLGFAEGASIYNSALLFEPVAVGKNTWVGPYVILDGSGGGVEIGSFCSISAGVHIYTHDTVKWALSGGQAAYDKGTVSIGDCTYIGAQTTIKPGVVIGKQCVVGANSYVNKNLEDCGIYAGSPIQRIGDVVGDGDKIRFKYYSEPRKIK